MVIRYGLRRSRRDGPLQVDGAWVWIRGSIGSAYLCLSFFFWFFFFGLLLFVVVIVLIFGLWVWDDVYWVGDGTLWGFCARVTELTDLCLLRSCICLSRLISVPV